MKSVHDLNIQEYLVLFRHWKWADIVREQYEKSEEKFGTSLLFEQKNGFKFIWYALVYVVIEFIEKQKLSFPEIKKEIDSVKDSLRLCRNATFHIQSALFTEKYSTEIVINMADEDISKIHAEIGKNIRSDLKKRIAEIPPKVKMMHGVTDDMPEQYLIHKLYFLQGHPGYES